MSLMPKPGAMEQFDFRGRGRLKGAGAKPPYGGGGGAPPSPIKPPAYAGPGGPGGAGQFQVSRVAENANVRAALNAQIAGIDKLNQYRKGGVLRATEALDGARNAAAGALATAGGDPHDLANRESAAGIISNAASQQAYNEADHQLGISGMQNDIRGQVTQGELGNDSTRLQGGIAQANINLDRYNTDQRSQLERERLAFDHNQAEADRSLERDRFNFDRDRFNRSFDRDGLRYRQERYQQRLSNYEQARRRMNAQRNNFRSTGRPMFL